MIRVLTLILIFNFAALGQNSEKMFIIDETGKSILRIFVNCEYALVLKNPKDKEVNIFLNQMGNGYFAGEHGKDYDFVISASHLFLCNSTIGELELRGVLNELDKDHKEDISIENLLAIKYGKRKNILAYTHEGVSVGDIRVLFDAPSMKTLGDSDGALLRVKVLEGTEHIHLPLMEDKFFDEIFYKSGIGKDVVARGFLVFMGGWFLRYRNAVIEWVRAETFQINEILDPGLSGGPITFYYNGKIYAIGIISSGPIQVNVRVLDFSWATIVKKSFLDNKNKK